MAELINVGKSLHEKSLSLKASSAIVSQHTGGHSVRTTIVCVFILGSALLGPATANASLLGATVDLKGVFGGLPVDDLGVKTVTSGGAAYAATPDTGTDFLVTPTQITLTNELIGTPFCTSSTVPCPDVFDGFTFKFAGGTTPNILGVTVDPASAATFPPIALSLLSPSEISLNLVDDVPVLGDKLILDLRFASVGAPEPSTWAYLMMGLMGLGAALRLRGSRGQARV